MMNKSVMKCCICNNNNVGEYDVINHKKYHICCIEDLKRRVDEAIKIIDECLLMGTNEYEIEEQLEELKRVLGGKE